MALSRAEDILLSKIGGDSYNTPPQSRLEKLLLRLNTGTGADTSELTKDVDTLKQNVTTLSNYITKNANSIGNLQETFASAQKKIAANQSNIQIVSEAMDSVYDEIAVMQKGVEELNNNIRDIQEDVIRIEDHVRQHHIVTDDLEDSNGEEVLDSAGTEIQTSYYVWNDTIPIDYQQRS